MKYKIKDYTEMRQLVESMSVEELLCVVTCPDINSDEVYTNTASAFLHPATHDEIIKRVELLNSGRTLPLIICADTESGADVSEQTTLFPSLRACAVADDENLAYKFGKIAASEALEYGITWGLAPCVDINFDTDDPVCANNCPGTEKEIVIKIGCAVIDGMQSNGLAASAKHFPGGGMSRFDPHLTVAENTLGYEEWKQSYGEVYKAVINSGVKTIMPGHISLACIDQKNSRTGEFPPATLSEALINGLLKNELGFEGLIVSDAITMGGFCSFIEYHEACALFLMSGGDLLLFAHPDKNFIAEMTRLIELGNLDVDVLRNRAYRVLCFAKENGTAGKCEVTAEEKKRVLEEIASKGIVVERDRYSHLPVNLSGQRILLNVISHCGIRDFDNELKDELEQRGCSVTMISDAGCNKICSLIKSKEYDLCICTVNPLSGYGINSSRLSGTIARNMMGGWQKFGVPVIFVTHSNNFKNEYKTSADIIINTHGYCADMSRFVCNKIEG